MSSTAAVHQVSKQSKQCRLPAVLHVTMLCMHGPAAAFDLRFICIDGGAMARVYWVAV